MKKEDRIFITNHERMPGRAFVRRLREKGFANLILKERAELDLLNSEAVSLFFKKEKPRYVFLTSIRSGGIQANIKSPAEFLYSNLQSQDNVIHSSWESGVKGLLFIGASCAYPKDAPQPMKEEYLLTGPLEPTSEPYSIAKITGIKMCQYYNRQYGANFISVIPATTFGPEDDYDIETAHVIPALLTNFHNAKIRNLPSVTIWGSGNARREFIYVDDLVDACIFLMENYNDSDVINVGPGMDISIRELALLIKDIVSFKGMLEFDKAKPEGVMHKMLDVSKLSQLGWKVKTDIKTDIKTGIKNTYFSYIQSQTKDVISKN